MGRVLAGKLVEGFGWIDSAHPLPRIAALWNIQGKEAAPQKRQSRPGDLPAAVT
jgi:hypothetical protein